MEQVVLFVAALIDGNTYHKRHARAGGHPGNSDTIVKEKQFFVYIVASKKNGTIYVGVTSDLIKRVWEHKNGLVDGFTKQYDIKMLVYYEKHEEALSAIKREKKIKKWRRQWKVNLIEKKNLHWKDLYQDIG